VPRAKAGAQPRVRSLTAPSNGSNGDDATLLLTVLRELKKGNFSVRMPVTSGGIMAKLATELNDIIELNQRNARNLSGVARVIGAVAEGDLFQTMDLEMDGRPLEGQFLRTARTVNSMVRQLRSFTSEVTRVAEEVGTEGKLGGQARVKGVAGVWKDLTDNVNSMASNLTAQVRSIAEVTTAVATGDLSKKITVDVRGEILELKNTINVMVDQLNAFASEVTRVAREVGTEGKLGGQAQVRGVGGVWKDLTENVNFMAGNLTAQVRNIADVTTAVAKGDLSKKITVDVHGEILELKDTINVMVDQLNAFASEVTRVAGEVGTEGRLGGQAQVEGVAGVWKDLTDNVNYMAGNLTSQVRNIAEVTTAVANGDLSKKITVDVRGEIRELKDTINVMVDQLNAFAGEVTRVAREVGTEGRLGGQASVPGASGTWKDLTRQVNQLAANLTNQVRAIAEVATAVTEGDLTRSVGVEAMGEVALLKDKINEMIRNLKETTQKNTEQDWLKTNLAKHTRILQGQRDLATVAELILTELAPLVAAQHGAFYIVQAKEGEDPSLRLAAGYAFQAHNGEIQAFRWGEGLVGQCARDGRRILLTTVPPGYVAVRSGLGEALPTNIVVLPVLFEGRTKAVIELASVQPFSRTYLDFLDQLTDSIGVVLNTIEANMRTEELLKQSQILFAEAQEASKSKSAFLSMAAHELRTPLSVIYGYLSMLQDGSISPDKWERPLSVLIGKAAELNRIVDDLLTAARIEGGTVPTEVKTIDLREMTRQAISRAEARAALLKAEMTYEEPHDPVMVDADKEQIARVIDNLINNALTYSSGQPWLKVTVADQPGPAITIQDRGIGIAPAVQGKVFERFYRIDDSAIGPQPGTGLGLYISRELAERHAGSLILERSEVGKGSTFVLRLPAAAAERQALLHALSTPSRESATV
jgi:signal transduction histidine kinase/HAMP domain-containing protein